MQLERLRLLTPGFLAAAGGSGAGVRRSRRVCVAGTRSACRLRPDRHFVVESSKNEQFDKIMYELLVQLARAYKR